MAVGLFGSTPFRAREIGEDPLDRRLRWLTLATNAPNETIGADELESRQKVQQSASNVPRKAATGIDWARERNPGSGGGIALGRYVDTFVGQAGSRRCRWQAAGKEIGLRF